MVSGSEEERVKRKAERWRQDVVLLQRIADYVRVHGRTHYTKLAMEVGRSPSWVLQRRYIIEELFEDIFYDDGFFDVLPSFRQDAEEYKRWLIHLRELRHAKAAKEEQKEAVTDEGEESVEGK